MIRSLLLLLLTAVSIRSPGQRPQGDVIDVAHIQNYYAVDSEAGVFVDVHGQAEAVGLPGLHYDQRLLQRFKRGNIPTRQVGLPLYYHFLLRNSDTVPHFVYFFPGFYFRDIALFSDSASRIVRLPDAKPPHGEAGCRILRVPARSLHNYYFRGELIKVNTNWLAPTLINPSFLGTYFEIVRYNTVQLNVISFVFCGILLMMVLYSSTNFVLNGRPEFLHYALYAAFMAFLFYGKSLYYRDDGAFYLFFGEYFDYIVQLCGYCFYIQFTRLLLDTRRRYPWLDRVLRISIGVLVSIMAVYSMVYFSGGRFETLNTIENGGKYFLMALGIFYVTTGFAQRNPLMNYLVAGNLALLLLAALSLCIIVFKIHLTGSNYVLDQAMFYYELGVVVELVLFLAALAYKNKTQLVEREKKEFETRLAILQAQQEERSRISADMHDELGSGVTVIRLLSELAKRKVRPESVPEIEKISSSADDLMDKMDTIIWSLNATNDSLFNTIAYIRSFAIGHFDNTGVHCTVEVPEPIPDVELNGEKRRNIFLVVKEALNNALKHSGSSAVLVRVSFDDALSIGIRDYGKGMQAEGARRFSNGLTNMKKRMESIGGTLSIQSGEGTEVALSCPL